MRDDVRGALLVESKTLDFTDDIKPLEPKGQGRLFINYLAEQMAAIKKAA